MPSGSDSRTHWCCPFDTVRAPALSEPCTSNLARSVASRPVTETSRWEASSRLIVRGLLSSQVLISTFPEIAGPSGGSQRTSSEHSSRTRVGALALSCSSQESWTRSISAIADIQIYRALIVLRPHVSVEQCSSAAKRDSMMPSRAWTGSCMIPALRLLQLLVRRPANVD